MPTPTAPRRHGIQGWRTLTILAAGAAIVSGAPRQVQAQGGSMEYAVKAAYLYKFTPFVQWPPDAFASATSPFFLCVQGDDPFGPALDQATHGRNVEDHPVVVRRLRPQDTATGCQILYVADARLPGSASVLRSVRGSPVLTVSDQGRGDGAIIQFVVKAGHVRFSIDPALAAANHVAISSKLLSLAVGGAGK